MTSFLRPGGLDCLPEIDVFPRVDLGAVYLDRVRKDLPELRDGRRLPIGGDVHGREHDGEPVGLGETRHRHDVAYQQIVVDRCDRLNLARLVVDDNECTILRRQQRITERVAHRLR